MHSLDIILTRLAPLEQTTGRQSRPGTQGRPHPPQAESVPQATVGELSHHKPDKGAQLTSGQLLARRIAAFDRSPLNYCKLRALYRTLLTTDFAAPTNERPDSSRQYTEDEWYTYQAARDRDKDTPSAHEVVDIFWLSAAVRYHHDMDSF